MKNRATVYAVAVSQHPPAIGCQIEREEKKAEGIILQPNMVCDLYVKIKINYFLQFTYILPVCYQIWKLWRYSQNLYNISCHFIVPFYTAFYSDNRSNCAPFLTLHRQILPSLPYNLGLFPDWSVWVKIMETILLPFSNNLR